MTWIDYAILAIICISALVGLMRGLVREIFSLFSWIAALWVGIYYSSALSPALKAWISHSGIRTVTAFAILFLATLVLGKVVGYLIGSLIDQSLLSGVNRLGGMLFGGARGLLLVLILVLVADRLRLSHQVWWRQSQFLPSLEHFAEVLSQQPFRDYLHLVSKPLAFRN